MHINIFKAPGIVILFICFASCHQTNQDIPPVAHVRTDSIHSPKSSEVHFISALGILVIPSADIILITPQASGLIKSLSIRVGASVKKGDTLAIIENSEFLKLQQQYLEAKNEFIFFGEDLKRQGGLAIENATSVKKMQQAQRDYQNSEIRFRSLEKQLELIGFYPDSLDADHLSPDIIIRAPVSGYIDKIYPREGNQISAGETVFLLVKKYEPVISLELPEEYYSMLKNGNQFDFFLPGDSLVPFKARLIFINRHSDPSSHLVKALAVPLKSSSRLVPGMQVSLRLPL